MSSCKRKSCKDLDEASALALMRAIVVPLAKNCKLQGLAERGQRALSLINVTRPGCAKRALQLAPDWLFANPWQRESELAAAVLCAKLLSLLEARLLL